MSQALYANLLDSPKQIYRCDFPDCNRSFVRQDLCARHRERHSTKGSQLQRRDLSFMESPNPTSTMMVPTQPNPLRPQLAGGESVALSPTSFPSPMGGSYNHPYSTLTPSSMSNPDDASPPALSYSPSDFPYNNNNNNNNNRLSENPSVSSADSQPLMVKHENASPQMSSLNPSYSVPYVHKQHPVRLQMSPLPFQELPGLNTVPTVVSSPCEPVSSTFPVFGGETYRRTPFPMVEDFTSWLFNDPSQSYQLPRYHDIHVAPQNQQNLVFYTNEYGHNYYEVPQDMDVESPTISEEKRQELLQFMRFRFNDKQNFLDDNDDDDHFLGLNMMQTYINSYWNHFHIQLPILHRPTFTQDSTPNLLLLAIIAIGASTLDEEKGFDQEVTGLAADLANFITWHLRWEIFMDPDFRPPAKLWIFQALLLLEVHEKMYATRALHERAHIHHDTTLTLMRRGSSLIDQSAEGEDDRASTTEDSWTKWIKEEATRRVAFAAFVLDSTHTVLFGHSAKMVAHELRMPLPCDEAIWAAPNAIEASRVQQSMGNTTMFLDGLKQTLNGLPVNTSSFGRTILMAGLLNVSWHMNQRDLQFSYLGVAANGLGGREKWRSAILRALDNWRWDINRSIIQQQQQQQQHTNDDNMIETRDTFHRLAHISLHVDIIECQIYAGAKRLLGRSVTRQEYKNAKEKMIEWANKASARDAVYYSLKYLIECFINQDDYKARNDYLLNRPWVIYLSTLVIWSYGYALDGPLHSQQQILDQKSDMYTFLQRVGNVNDPNDLQTIPGRNQCLGLLLVVRDLFSHAKWELLGEAAQLLDCCIDQLCPISSASGI